MLHSTSHLEINHLSINLQVSCRMWHVIFQVQRVKTIMLPCEGSCFVHDLLYCYQSLSGACFHACGRHCNNCCNDNVPVYYASRKFNLKRRFFKPTEMLQQDYYGVHMLTNC